MSQRTQKAVAIEFINVFSLFGPPSILQAANGKEFSHVAATSRHIQLDKEVSISSYNIIFLIKTLTLSMFPFSKPSSIPVFWRNQEVMVRDNLLEVFFV